MINLARNKDCDIHIRAELSAAGIEVMRHVEMPRGEVPTMLYGKLGKFEFHRAWYYWRVSGDVPLEIARRIYDADKDKVVRVTGHCEAPHPDEWATRKLDGIAVINESAYDALDETVIQYIDRAISRRELVVAPDAMECDKFITNYHIDSQEGLDLFVKFAKDIQ